MTLATVAADARVTRWITLIVLAPSHSPLKLPMQNHITTHGIREQSPHGSALLTNVHRRQSVHSGLYIRLYTKTSELDMSVFTVTGTIEVCEVGVIGGEMLLVVYATVLAGVRGPCRHRNRAGLAEALGHVRPARGLQPAHAAGRAGVARPREERRHDHHEHDGGAAYPHDRAAHVHVVKRGRPPG